MNWWLVGLLFMAVVIDNTVLSMSTRIKISMFDSVGPIGFSGYCCNKKCDDPTKHCKKKELGLGIDNAHRRCDFTCSM